MKLRAKLVDQPHVIHRIEIQQGPASLGSLQAALVSAVPALNGLPPSSVRVSLNKKVVLSDDPSALLGHLGVCSGDTLWVLPVPTTTTNNNTSTTGSSTSTLASNAPPAAHATGPSTAPAHQHTKRLCTDSAEAGHQTNQARTTTAVASQQRPATQHITGSVPRDSVTAGRPAPEPEAMDVDGHEGPPGESLYEKGPVEDHHMAGPLEDLERVIQDADVSLQAPTHLLRTLQVWSSFPPSTSPTTSSTTTTITTTPSQTIRFAAHQLLLLATHAAMSEQGFTLTTPPSPNPTTPPRPPPQAHEPPHLQHILLLPPSGILSLAYTYPPLSPTNTTDQTESTASQGEASTSVGAEAGACCELRVVVAGPHLLLHAAVTRPIGPGTGSRTVTLDTRHLVNVTKATEAMRDIDNNNTSENTTSDNSTRDATNSRKRLIDMLGALSCVTRLWVTLQDDLVIWAVRSACTALGRSPPGGFMGLPRELRMEIMAKLKARDLARLTCTCVELRHWGGSNALWEPLFNSEFPSAPLTVKNAAAQRGFQAAFGMAWRARRDLERMRMRHLRGPPPRYILPVPDPYNPFMPTPQRYPSNIIGGDYDRLPALPGFPGMPGMPPGTGPFIGGIGRPGPAGFMGGSSTGGRGIAPQPLGMGRARREAGGWHGTWG